MRKIPLLLASFFFMQLMLSAQEESLIPVRISFFDATSGNHLNKLYWKTACSLDYANFEIQRSYTGSDYTTIHTFTADRFRCTQPFDYSDINANQLAGKVFYRLKVGDRDGRVYNSKIVTVLTRGEGIEINSFTPTIVTGSASVSISSSTNNDAIITIINIQGLMVNSHKIRLTKGLNIVPLPTADLRPGKYWIKLVNSKNEVKTTPFFKQ